MGMGAPPIPSLQPASGQRGVIAPSLDPRFDTVYGVIAFGITRGIDGILLGLPLTTGVLGGIALGRRSAGPARSRRRLPFATTSRVMEVILNATTPFELLAGKVFGVGTVAFTQYAAIMPMTLLSTAGYMIGVYAAMGLLDIKAGWIVVMTQVPFLSPFMMLGRIAVGVAEPWEILLSMALLVLSIGLAIWVAARIYAVGVLLYGQRPGARAVWKLLRQGM